MNITSQNWLTQCEGVLGGHQGVAKQLLRPSERFLAKVFW